MLLVEIKKLDVGFLVDMSSFPVKCAELRDFCNLMNEKHAVIYTNKTPTAFFKEALELTEKFELVIPVTRNMYVRDRLRREGVNLVVCL